jgi:pyruvate,orthophosphate dikinase
LTTAVCRDFHQGGSGALDELWPALVSDLGWLEQETDRTFGTGERPLLVSVRSGAAVSMPGMMDTVLNIGLTSSVHAALASVNQIFADDVRTRLHASFTELVLEREHGNLPEDALVQLRLAIEAVLRSWTTSRAQTYRKHHGLDEHAGTAVTVQAMVFGNLDAQSGSGVLFTRDPRTGSHEAVGDWLPCAQGEDVVSGKFDPLPLSALKEQQPDVHRDLLGFASTLERQRRDVQDIEFTFESGRLWLLQTRAVKRSAAAAVRFAVDFCREGLIDESEAVSRVSDRQLAALDATGLSDEQRARGEVLARGEPVSPGVASGVAVFDSDEAEERADNGEQVILVRPTTSPDDLHAMIASAAIVTAVGGATSHAALVSREIGKPCIVGVGVGALVGIEGRIVTVDANAGLVLVGEVLPVSAAHADPWRKQFETWHAEHACRTTS